MDESAKVEQARVRGESLEQIAQRFRRWRESRKRGEHIPPALWLAAVGMAKEHGLYRIAHELRIDHDGLKKRLERVGGVARSGKVDTRFEQGLTCPNILPTRPRSSGRKAICSVNRSPRAIGLAS